MPCSETSPARPAAEALQASDGTVVVIGYGNVLRGDDAAGPYVAERVGAEGLPGVSWRAERMLTPELAHDLSEVGAAVFVDADAEADAVSVESVAPDAAPRGAATHSLRPGQLLRLCETAYGRAPRAWLVRVPGRAFELGATMRAETARAVESAAQAVLDLARKRSPEEDQEGVHV